VLRSPNEDFSGLADLEKDKLRQTQVEEQEIIRVLGYHEKSALIMKWDGTLGWLSKNSFGTDPDLQSPVVPDMPVLMPQDFFKFWQGTPYVWGGITKSGIDCSGFTQRYYLQVLRKTIPKNSRDQRKLGKACSLEKIGNHDLVFCFRKGGNGTHHVGVFIDGDVWHAQLERGVICQGLDQFRELYEIEEVVTFFDGLTV
jgi:hypothetical protein